MKENNIIDSMTPRILVMGGGQQGKIIAEDLAQNFCVDIVDVIKPSTNIRWIKADLSDVSILMNLLPKYELIINALPSRIGGNASYIAINKGLSLVDLSFHDWNPEKLKLAIPKKHGNNIDQTIILDAGFAPGISDLIVGHECPDTSLWSKRDKKTNFVKIYVGGVASDKNQPYGHVNTWSIEDLEQEYIRGARYIEDNKEKVAFPLLYPLERVEVKGFIMESFITDGLRSLLSQKIAPNMIEKTLRWPGHIKQVTPLIKNKVFVKTLKEKCNNGKDIALMKIIIQTEEMRKEFSLIEHGTDKMSAMTKLTAYSCAAFTRSIFSKETKFNKINYRKNRKKFFKPSDVGRDPQAVKFILDYLEKKGINTSGLKDK